MKAVVVEINNNVAAVLSDNGCITKVKNKDYMVGQMVQIGSPTIRLYKKISVFAASAAAFVLMGTAAWAYASPYAYVSMDVNPSIEFTVNRFDRVLQVKAVNDDGEEILKSISMKDLKNKSIEDALTRTVDQISDAGYFDGSTEGGIVIATSSQDMDKADTLAQDLQESVEQQTIDNGDEVAVEAFSVKPERVEEAKSLGVTPGKLNLVEKLKAAASDPNEVNVEEWLNKPVKEIMKATKDYKKSSKQADQESIPAKEDQKITSVPDQSSEDKSQPNGQNKEDKDLSKSDKDNTNQEKLTEQTGSSKGNEASDIIQSSKPNSSNNDKVNDQSKANPAGASKNTPKSSDKSKNTKDKSSKEDTVNGDNSTIASNEDKNKSLTKDTSDSSPSDKANNESDKTNPKNNTLQDSGKGSSQSSAGAKDMESDNPTGSEDEAASGDDSNTDGTKNSGSSELSNNNSTKTDNIIPAGTDTEPGDKTSDHVPNTENDHSTGSTGHSNNGNSNKD